MDYVLIVLGCIICAFLAIRTRRLLISALWLAGCSALTALLLYLLGAPEIAVIELSVGAGLVTVLFVFAINIAGEEMSLKQNLLPKPLAWALVAGAVLLLGWMVLGPISGQTLTGSETGFAAVLWNDRALDVVLQVLLIFAGVLGVLGLLSDVKNTPKDGNNEH
jgi:uncharacterized MnhB-related membrane protein